MPELIYDCNRPIIKGFSSFQNFCNHHENGSSFLFFTDLLPYSETGACKYASTAQ